MCGFAGILNSQLKDDEISRYLVSMGVSLSHRGPDHQGLFIDESRDIGLVHRRLSILDLDSRANQPMRSKSGNCLVFNGEIYNYRALRGKLINYGCDFKTSSDTEVLLQALETWGVDATLEKVAGMFAFAFINQQEGKLFLARDRLGEKPLYIGSGNGRYFFGSELHAFRDLPWFSNQVNKPALQEFYKFNYVPDHSCIYENVEKLEPGSLIQFQYESKEWHLAVRRRWWAPKIPRMLRSPIPRGKKAHSLHAKQGELEALFDEVVSETLVADVEVGLFLSGGVDSSLICAVANKVSDQKIRTFSIGFNDQQYDESSAASTIANSLGTEHQEFILTPQSLIDIVQDMAEIYDEPFADSSQIPAVFLSREVRKTVKVALTGDGGDELFGGYNRYLWIPKIRNLEKLIGRNGVRILAKILKSVSLDIIKKAEVSLTRSKRLAPGVVQFAEKRDKLISCLSAETPRMAYEKMLQVPEFGVPGLGREQVNRLEKLDYIWDEKCSMVEKMMLSDMAHYLPGDILTKVDRASMSTSLECRAPMLDKRIVDFALELPQEFKIGGRQGKIILRSLLRKYLPSYPEKSAKQGFAVPLGNWLRGPLKKWAENYFFLQPVGSIARFDSTELTEIWQRHQSGYRNYAEIIWGQIVLNLWCEANLKDRAAGTL